MDQSDNCEDLLLPQGERWAPLGAVAEPETDSNCDEYDDQEYWTGYCSHDSEKLRILEEEQEQLNSSLMALTSHFAQVQFRLKQIVEAEPDTKETLLKELEEFAFRGIPDFQKSMRCVEGAQNSDEDHATKMESHRLKQQELIEQLKQQLEDLERYAYETGEAGLPQTLVVERQKIIIDQMKNKLQLNVDDLDKFTVEELRQQVDQAIGQLVNPLKMKEQLVTQLKTQITDLERFIEFLQGPPDNSQCHCSASKPVLKPVSRTGASQPYYSLKMKEQLVTQLKTQITDLERFIEFLQGPPDNSQCHCSASKPVLKPVSRTGASQPYYYNPDKNNEKVNQTLRRMSNLLQIYVVSQFGCGVPSSKIPKEMPKEKNKEFREIKTRLGHAVHQIMRLAVAGGDGLSSWEPDGQVETVKAVRKGLCPVLRDILHYGMITSGSSTSLVPFLSCAAPRPSPSTSSSSVVHPWKIFVSFYRTKDGQSLMSNPQRSLAQSFSLEIQGGTSKQSLLVAIGNIIEMHRPFKRGPEAHFKAFVSSALNSKKMVPWLRIMLRSPTLLDEFYEPWAYVLQPGFDDIWKILEPLQTVDFQLPEDLSIRSLRNIFDAF
nr:EOG090X03YR [Polyphemus pediculus]